MVSELGSKHSPHISFLVPSQRLKIPAQSYSGSSCTLVLWILADGELRAPAERVPTTSHSARAQALAKCLQEVQIPASTATTVKLQLHFPCWCMCVCALK